MKAFERIILKRIMNKLGDKLSSTQAGFRGKRSTIDNLYYLWSSIHHRWKDCEKEVRPFMAAFLDFSKAFDRTWHNGILYKIYQFGIRGRAWYWIRRLRIFTCNAMIATNAIYYILYTY